MLKRGINMKKLSVFISFILLAASGVPAFAQWSSVKGLYDREIRTVACHPSKPGVLYAGTSDGLYQSLDRGATWKRVLKLRSAGSAVTVIRIDPDRPDAVYAGTEEGVYRSLDGGKKWERIFQRAEADQENVLAIGFAGAKVLAGTASGLFLTENGGNNWVSAPPFNESAVHQIERLSDGSFLASSDRGLFRSEHGTPADWNRIYARSVQEPEAAPQDGNSQFESEAIPLNPGRRIAFMPLAPSEILLVDDSRVLISRDSGNQWESAKAETLPGHLTGNASVLSSPDKLMLPSDLGIFYYEANNGVVRQVGWGLPTSNVREVAYDPAGDAAYAATDKGIYKLSYPEMTVFLKTRMPEGSMEADGVFRAFDHEPSIQELQSVAARYAEVHPEKILEWRRGAALKPWLPSLSVGMDRGVAQNVDIDRGGTADPDRFISGPSEQDRDYSVDLQWDISNLIWNDDQTSIDNRSKLMVQLRDDLMNELNHLYFARRRLQIQSFLSEEKDLAAAVDRRLQIDEYTAGIDALTGGYLTRRLKEIEGSTPV